MIVMLHQTFYWAFQLPPDDKVGFFSFMPMLPWALVTIREMSWGTR